MDLKLVNKEIRRIIRRHGGRVPRLTREEKQAGDVLHIDSEGIYWANRPGPDGAYTGYCRFRQPENLQWEMSDAGREIFEGN